MTAENVRELVLTEVGDAWERSNLHGVDLRTCLLATPEYLQLKNPAAGSEPIAAWLVLLEDPGTRRGYGVVYDESAEQFGLTQLDGRQSPLLIGLYGGLFDALEAM